MVAESVDNSINRVVKSTTKLIFTANGKNETFAVCLQLSVQ